MLSCFHPFIHSSVHPFIHPSIHAFAHHSSIHASSIHPSMRPFVHSSMHAFIDSSIDPSIHSDVHEVASSIDPSIHSDVQEVAVVGVRGGRVSCCFGRGESESFFVSIDKASLGVGVYVLHPFIHSSIHPFIHSPIHPFMMACSPHPCRP
jgi:hypothetical protein